MENYIGPKKPVVIAIDGVNLYCIKRSGKRPKEPITQPREDKRKLLEIPLKSIIQIERAIYDDKRVYIWYWGKTGEKQRVVFEMEEVVFATELLAKIRFIAKCDSKNKTARTASISTASSIIGSSNNNTSASSGITAKM